MVCQTHLHHRLELVQLIPACHINANVVYLHQLLVQLELSSTFVGGELMEYHQLDHQNVQLNGVSNALEPVELATLV